MFKHFKSVGTLLLMLGGAAGVAQATPLPVVAQQSEVCKGIVKDETGETVIGASVVVKGTTNGTITDVDGSFTLSNVRKGDVIEVSYIGYKTLSVVYDGSALNLVLSSDTQALEEVVVVGFGTQKKVNLTGSVAVVGPEELTSRPVANVTQALQGLVPGMNFSYNKNGGRVGQTMSINVRGTGTLDANVASGSPLVLIDGMEGDMNTLNPNDIESISVLKDAAASSIYGSRAPYGVILVTTKRGKAGKVSVNYNNSFRWSKGINMPKMANSYDFARYLDIVQMSDGNTSLDQTQFPQEHLDRIQGYLNGTFTDTTIPNKETPTIWEWKGNANVDWIDEIFGGTGFSQEHALSVNGGSEKMQYFFSANYMDQNGIIRYGDEGLQRYNVNGKISATIAPWLKANYNMKFTRQDLTQPWNLDSQDFYYNVIRRWPTQPVLDPNGNYLTELPKQLMWGGNNNQQTDWVVQQMQLEIEPVKNWKTFVELNYKTINTLRDEERLIFPKYGVDGEVYQEASDKSSIYSYSERTNFFNTNIYSEYTHQWNQHTLKGMVGFQAELNKYRKVGAKKEDLITQDVIDINTATGLEYAYGGNTSWATAGFFGRINYNYAERYLAEVNLRYDGTSRFARDKRWNLFPSFSLGWNVAREAFMEDMQDVINNLKFRGSWGQLGNQNTTNLYPYIATMPYYPITNSDNHGWMINGSKYPGSTSPALISALLTWETMSSWNIGFDLGMLNNRLTMSFDYFVRTTKDMVGPAPELPVTLGKAVPKANNADMRSYGFELDLAWRDQIGGFRYGVHVLLSDDRQKILKYPNDAGTFGSNQWRKDMYLGEIWGLTTIGIAKTQEEMDAHLASLPNGGQNALGSTDWQAGDIMYADINKDGKISKGNTVGDPGDLSIIGNSTPRYKFGLDLDAAWKGFDLRLFFQGVAKRDWAFAESHAVYWGNAGGIWQSNVFENNMDFFRPNDPNSQATQWFGANVDARFPRLTTNHQNRYAQTGYLENAAYVRLKNFQLGYTLPNSWTSKAGISNVRIFFSAENLFTIDGLPDGIDPETLGGGDYGGIGTYPLTRTFSTGISVNF